MRNALSCLFPVALVLGVALACANAPTPNNRRAAESSQKPGTAPVNSATPKRSAWGYSEYDDEMGRGKVFHTSTQSTNTISLGFPYEGPQHCILSIREHPEYGRDVYLTIEKGQLLDSDYHSKVVVRFDDDKPRSFSSVKPADLSSDTLFLRGGAFPVFISRLKTAKTVRVEVPIYQAGNRIFDFDAEGFAWKK